jgi:hypothetical protein
VQSLEAFYPNERATDLGSECQKETGFLPLEILVDQRSEAIDYDRIVQKADIAVSYDKFNQLRIPRGMDWPKARDDLEQTVDHLRYHQA